MDLNSLNRINDEAKGLDQSRNACKNVRLKANAVRNMKGTLVSLLMDTQSNLRRHPDTSDKLLMEYICGIIEPMREDILAQIELRMQAEEKLLLMKAAAKRQLITASIVSAPPAVDGGAS